MKTAVKHRGIPFICGLTALIAGETFDGWTTLRVGVKLGPGLTQSTLPTDPFHSTPAYFLFVNPGKKTLSERVSSTDPKGLPPRPPK
jgi:hypothetical protein